MTNESGSLTNHDESKSGLSNTLPGHRAGSPSLLTLLGPDPKAAAGFKRYTAHGSTQWRTQGVAMPPKHGAVADVSATISGVAQGTDYDRTGRGYPPS
jgi:hypothetical protein